MATVSGSYNFKVVLLGEGCVGKTSCVLRYVDDKFNDRHLTTLQASFLSKKLNIRGKRVNLSLWDTAGQERFHALGPIYYRDANGAVLVYDITDADSFAKVKNWIKELRKMLGNEISLAIAGNKIDLEKQRHVSLQQAEEYAKSVGATHFNTSAKMNQGIEELFLHLSQQMMVKADDKAKNTPGSGSSSNSNSFGGSTRSGGITVVDDSELPQRQKSGCCGGGGGRSVMEGQPDPMSQ